MYASGAKPTMNMFARAHRSRAWHVTFGLLWAVQNIRNQFKYTAYLVDPFFLHTSELSEAARKHRSMHKTENSLLRFIKRVPIDRLRASFIERVLLFL